MTDGAQRDRARRRAVRIDVDVAERLLEASAQHARGVLSDAEFLEARERILTADADPGADGTT